MTTLLSPQDRQTLEADLVARRASLQRHQASHLAGQTRAEHAREVLLQDGDDAAQRDADREVDLAQGDRNVTDLAAVDAALTRLAQGRYGLCAGCGGPIALARLRLSPEATQCIACATEAERGQARSHSL